MTLRCPYQSIPDRSADSSVFRQFAVNHVNAQSITVAEKAEQLPAVLFRIRADIDQ